uniref:RING-type domain-containing protein n=1 Tax=Ananas comosus var. bracteatus TaxID=296719 RepID=A0A6V7NTQ9_ANACO|nr:unnamed protein product [Ananas comosus var. bracteatus]
MSARDNGDLVPIAATNNPPTAPDGPMSIQVVFMEGWMDLKILASLPVFFSSSVDLEEKPNTSLDQEENLECSVCNSEFKADKKGILLPKCGDRFHVQCIDKWFQLRSACPLCRPSVEAESP